MIAKEQSRWQDLGPYTSYVSNDLRDIVQDADRYYEFLEGEGEDCFENIRNEFMEAALRKLPKISRLVFMDFYSAQVEFPAMTARLPKTELEKSRQWVAWNDQLQIWLSALAETLGNRVKSLIIGPYVFEHTMAYWEERRRKGIHVNERDSLYYIPIWAVDELWQNNRKDLKSISNGLRALYLPIGTSNPETWLNKTSLPSFIESASPNLTHLTIDIKGLTDRSLDGASHLVFGDVFAKFVMPYLHHLDLRGWVFLQDDIERLLLRHAGILRELRLLHNVMVSGEHEALADFGRCRLSLVGVELFNVSDAAHRSANRPVLDDSAFEVHGYSQSRENNEILELRWLTGRPNRIEKLREM